MKIPFSTWREQEKRKQQRQQKGREREVANGGNSNNVVGNFIGLLADGKTQSRPTESSLANVTGERGRVSAPSASLGALTRPRSPDRIFFDAGFSNQKFGVKIEVNSTLNVIGGAIDGDKNTISGNIQYGVQFDGTLGQATKNTIEENNIGTINDGTNGGVGNGTTGIVFTNGANANVVKMNRIKYNKSAAVLKEDVGSNQNLVYDPNAIASNGSGIDDGTNDGPALTSAVASGNSITIQGTLASTPSTSFLLEFFGNSAEDPSGYGEGEFYLGEATVATDTNGNAFFTVTLNAVYRSAQ